MQHPDNEGMTPCKVLGNLDEGDSLCLEKGKVKRWTPVDGRVLPGNSMRASL